jgi:hypothetical protein
VIEDPVDLHSCNVELVQFATNEDGAITEVKTDLGQTVTYQVS